MLEKCKIIFKYVSSFQDFPPLIFLPILRQISCFTETEKDSLINMIFKEPLKQQTLFSEHNFDKDVIFKEYNRRVQIDLSEHLA